MTEKDELLQTLPSELTPQQNQAAIDVLTTELQPENPQIQAVNQPKTVLENIEPEKSNVIADLQPTKNDLQTVSTIQKPNKSAKKTIAEIAVKKSAKPSVIKAITPKIKPPAPVETKKEDNRYILSIAYSGEEADYMRSYLQLRVQEGNANTTTQAIKQLIDFAANFKPVYKLYTGKEPPFFIGFPDGLEPRLLKDSIMAGKCTITVCK